MSAPDKQGASTTGARRHTASDIRHTASTASAPRKAAGDETAYPPEFEALWLVYPKRGGGNSKRAAFRAWRARRKGDIAADALHNGVMRYAAFVEASGKVGTEFVMQGATFFGPDEHWRESWAPPSAPTSSGGAAAATRGHVLLELLRRYDLFAYNGDREAYEAKLVKAASDAQAGPNFREECRAIRPWLGLDAPNDHLKAVEIDRRVAARNAA